jgi:predicted nucleotidyltransferase
MKTFSKFYEEFSSGLEYHDELNPKIWDGDKLRPEVKIALDVVTQNFIKFLKIDSSKISDVVLTGSSANFNYTGQSDLDIHVIVNFDPNENNSIGLHAGYSFNTAKTLYNLRHKITIHGYPVEAYVQPESEHFNGNAGVYSLRNQMWVQHPQKQSVDFGSKEIQRKAQPIIDQINYIVDNNIENTKMIKDLKAKVKQLRAVGMEDKSEFSIENSAFKAIRNGGYLEKLSNFASKVEDKLLSLE